MPKSREGRREFGRELIAKQHQTGVPVRALFQQHGVSEYSFYQWRKRLEQRLPVKFALVEPNQVARIPEVVEVILTSGMTLPAAENSDDHDGEPPPSVSGTGGGKPRGRKPLPRHLKRERIEHDLLEGEKHCPHCDQDLRRIGEEVSERYEYIPAQMKSSRMLVSPTPAHVP
jgi:transposase-like protein